MLFKQENYGSIIPSNDYIININKPLDCEIRKPSEQVIYFTMFPPIIQHNTIFQTKLLEIF